VAGPQSRPTTKYGLICAATQRDGADFFDLFVTRRSSRPATVHSSLLDLEKIRSRRYRQEFDDTP